MGYVQLGKHVFIGGEEIAHANEHGEVVAIVCDACNEVVEYIEGFEMVMVNGSWECKKCSVIN